MECDERLLLVRRDPAYSRGLGARRSNESICGALQTIGHDVAFQEVQDRHGSRLAERRGTGMG